MLALPCQYLDSCGVCSVLFRQRRIPLWSVYAVVRPPSVWYLADGLAVPSARNDRNSQMLKSLRIQNFKSWKDTGPIRLAPITVFFGANSAGKTSLLQFLLMLKQTSESSDRGRVIHFGDNYSLVELGTFQDLIFEHDAKHRLAFDLSWTLPQ